MRYGAHPQCSMTRASTEATECRHRATTHSVSPWLPPGRQSTQRLCKMYPLCWPFWWPSRCAGTIARITRWRRFVAFIKATKHRNRASTCFNSINQTCLPLFQGYFIFKFLKKSSSCPNNNMGVTHQTDEKHLNNLVEFFVVCWGGNIAFNHYNNHFLWRVIKQ